MSVARTAEYLSLWRQAILDDIMALLNAFAEARKAAGWVMQRHFTQLEADAKVAAEGKGLSLNNGSGKVVMQMVNGPSPLHLSPQSSAMTTAKISM